MSETKTGCGVSDQESLSTTSEAAQAQMERVGAGPWGEDERFPRCEWRYEVANNETVLGYFDWLSVKRLEVEDDESLLSPTGKPIVGRASRAFAIEYGSCTTRNGAIEFEFSGDEKIDWNLNAGQDDKGFVYVDAEGGRWEAAQLLRSSDHTPSH